MIFKNKDRWIPKKGRKANSDNIITITDIIHLLLNEAYHVYNRDNKDYNHAIKTALLQCIHEYLERPNNLIYFNNKYYTCARINCDFDNLIKSVYIYMNIGNNENIYNVAYNNGNNNLFKSHVELHPIINRKTKKIEYKDVEVFDKVSIICECDNDILNPKNINYYIGAVRHELIHILHETRKKIINVYAGESDFYASELSSIIDIEFPFWKYLLQININNISNNDFILIMSACIYYLDTSEYSAWLDNYYSQLQEVFQYNRFVNDTDLIKLKSIPLTYKIMFTINVVLKTYKSQIIELFDLHKSNSHVEILKDYMNTVGIPNKSIKALISHYIKRSLTFLEKCNQIFEHAFYEKYSIEH